MTISTIDFLINKQDLHQTQFVTGERDADALTPGQVLFKVEKFSFTANNITYGLLGDSNFKYWQFFPADDADWGKLPVWGFGEVIGSRHDEVAVGERMFGYFPLATHLVIDAGKASARSIVDVAEHRRELSPIYNQYSRVDSSGDEQGEALYALLRPLFVTAFLLEDYLADNDFFGGEGVVLTSASSKTAYATAFLLERNRSERRDYEIIGLTSAGNVDFVESLGCYDHVVSYDDLDQLTTDQPVALADLTGNGGLISRLHHHYQDQIKYSGMVGLSHQGGFDAGDALPGIRPGVFFAPTQLQKRLGEWGAAEYVARLSDAWDAFIDQVTDWVAIEERSGMEAIEEVYASFMEGDVSPGQGFILSF